MNSKLCAYIQPVYNPTKPMRTTSPITSPTTCIIEPLKSSLPKVLKSLPTRMVAPLVMRTKHETTKISFYSLPYLSGWTVKQVCLYWVFLPKQWCKTWYFWGDEKHIPVLRCQMPTPDLNLGSEFSCVSFPEKCFLWVATWPVGIFKREKFKFGKPI